MSCIKDYVKNNSEAQRLYHIDLSTPCEDAYYLKNTNYKNKGDIVLSHSGQMQQARKALTKYLGLSGSTNRYIHTRHMCNNNTKHGGKCVNPLHLAFGTAKENSNDIPVAVRVKSAQAAGGKSSKSQLKKGTHIMQQKSKVVCPHCGKIGTNLIAMKRHHFDNCKEVK